MSEFDVAQMIDRKGICPAWSCRPELCVGSGVDPGSLGKMSVKMERRVYTNAIHTASSLKAIFFQVNLR